MLRRVNADSRPGPGLLRCLAVMVYDALLLLALLIAATLVVVLIRQGSVPSGHPVFQLYLLAVCVAFYGGFWTHGGQTLGMKTWRVRLVRSDGGTPTWAAAIVRLGAAILSWLPLGLGFIWVLFDSDRLTWHDRLSGTRLVLLPKPNTA